MPTERMGPPPGALPPMRMTASWSGSERTYRIQVCGAKMPPMASSPRIIIQTGAVRHWSSKKGPSPVHRPSACSGVKALRNTSLARRQSRQALLAFRSLDPLRALREPDRRRRDEKRPFPLRTKTVSTTQNNRLTGKAPYKPIRPMGRVSQRGWASCPSSRRQSSRLPTIPHWPLLKRRSNGGAGHYDCTAQGRRR